MKNKVSAKQFFLSLLIFTVKLLILIKKLVLAIIIYVIYKPLRLILLFIFKRPVIRLYSYYILGVKRIREFNQRHKNQYAIFNRLFSSLIIGSIAIVLLLNNFVGSSHPEELINEAQAAAISSLVKNEFDGEVSNELITENINENYICQDLTSNNYGEDVLMELLPQMNTTIEKAAETPTETCLGSGNESLTKPEIITIGKGTPERRGISNYVVKIGDTISSIAKQFNISVNTVLWANNLGAYSTIREGNTLIIPPTSGIIYKVVKGDNIKKIAQKYNISTETIIENNDLDDEGKLSVGQELILPGAQKITSSAPTISRAKPAETISAPTPSQIKPAVTSGAKMQWPTVGYRITQYWSWRHTGLDIANKVGTPLYAAADGTVEYSGWNSGGYGYMVFVNHGGGTKTRYAHASKLLVSVGEKVKRGQVVALMGSTGRSTGPHIHFEVYINNKRVNPLNYIK